MIIDKDLLITSLDYATDHPAMPKESCEMYEVRRTLESTHTVLALTKEELGVVIQALEADCGYAESDEEVRIFDQLLESLYARISS